EPAVPAPVEPAPPVLRYQPAQWTQLPGWPADDVVAAWPALMASCASPRMPAAWQQACVQARAINPLDGASQRQWIETRLRPWRVTLHSADPGTAPQDTGLVTGYYEPVLNGA